MTPPRGCEAPTASVRVGFEVAWTTRTTERSRAGPRTSSGCGASCSRRAAGARAAAAERGHQQRRRDSRRPRPRSRGTAPRHLIATTARTWKPGVSRRFLSGSDGTRTRDLRRDRTAVDVIPSSLPQGQVFRNWERRHGRHRHAEAGTRCADSRTITPHVVAKAPAEVRVSRARVCSLGPRPNPITTDRLQGTAPCRDRPVRSPYARAASAMRLDRPGRGPRTRSFVLLAGPANLVLLSRGRERGGARAPRPGRSGAGAPRVAHRASHPPSTGNTIPCT